MVLLHVLLGRLGGGLPRCRLTLCDTHAAALVRGLAAWGSSSGCPALKTRGVAQATPHRGMAGGAVPDMLHVNSLRGRERAGLLSASTMSAGDADSVALQMPFMGHILVEYLQGRCCLLWAADPPPPQAFDLFGSAAAFDAATEARPRCAP